jgi:glycosyltransferase 2 family protein
MDTSSTGVATAERATRDPVQEHGWKTWFRRVPWARAAQGLIIVSLAVVLVATVRDLGSYDFTLLAKPYAASLGLALCAVLSLFLVWYRLLARISHRPVPLFVALRIFAYSWLGRYVPGRVWSSVGKVYVGKGLGLSTEELTLASLLEQILSNVAHIVLALFFLLFLYSGKVDSPAILISVGVLLLGAGLVVLQPSVLKRIVNLLLKRVGCGSLEQEHFPRGEEIMLFGLSYILPLILYGSSFWLIVVALDSTTKTSLLYLLGVFTIGSFVGKLSFVLPAGGIGVREAALVFMLQSTIGLPLAILASLMSRLSLALVDVCFVCSVSAVERLAAVK